MVKRRQSRNPDTHPGAFLGEQLRQIRIEAGYPTQEAFAPVIGADRSVIGKAETGEFPPTDPVLTQWLEACGIGGRLRVMFEGMTRLARSKNGGPVKVWFSGYLQAEAEAHTLRLWQPLIVHGLFQTEDYTRALFAAAGTGEDQIREQLQLRATRQAILARPSLPNIIAVIDETVLHRLIGTPEVMHKQLTRLLTLSEHIVIQVVPSRLGANAGLGGAITLAAGTGTPEVLAAEALVEDQVTQDIPQVLTASATFDRVRADALNRADSRAKMQEALDRWTTQ
jgi:hypothetical protein